MTPEQKAAFINAQAACAMCERSAMNWQNHADVRAGRPLTYSVNDFLTLADRYGIGHNAVASFFLS